MTIQEEFPDYLEVVKLPTGWATVHMSYCLDEEDGETYGYYDVENTSIGRWETKEEAIKEARAWSDSDGIILRKPI